METVVYVVNRLKPIRHIVLGSEAAEHVTNRLTVIGEISQRMAVPGHKIQWLIPTEDEVL